MPPSTLERVLVDGPAGAIETDINDPGADAARHRADRASHIRCRAAPRTTRSSPRWPRRSSALGYVAVRPNFRGVGASAGVHDEGRGETDDLLAVAAYAQAALSASCLLTCAGFSFGSFVQTRVARRIEAERLVLVGPAVNRFPAETVPPDTLVIHGEHDDVVPLAAVLDWARPQNLPIVVVPGGEHFFHGRLHLLAQIVARYCRP